MPYILNSTIILIQDAGADARESVCCSGWAITNAYISIYKSSYDISIYKNSYKTIQFSLLYVTACGSYKLYNQRDVSITCILLKSHVLLIRVPTYYVLITDTCHSNLLIALMEINIYLQTFLMHRILHWLWPTSSQHCPKKWIGAVLAQSQLLEHCYIPLSQNEMVPLAVHIHINTYRSLQIVSQSCLYFESVFYVVQQASRFQIESPATRISTECDWLVGVT